MKRSLLAALTVVAALAATAVPANAASLSVSAACLEPTPDGLQPFEAVLSGYAPDTQLFVAAEPTADQGFDYFLAYANVTTDADGNATAQVGAGDGTTVAANARSVFVKVRADSETYLSISEEPVCGRDDRDSDGVFDVTDNCPDHPNPGQVDIDRDGLGDVCDGDRDGDGVADQLDNCVNVANPGQADGDGDRVGDACDGDRDGDGVGNPLDNCPDDANGGQADGDGDRVGDACDGDRDGDGVGNPLDNCPDDANGGQADADRDGAGDACDGDRDGDGVGNPLDNCASDANAGQADDDGDGTGDACDPASAPNCSRVRATPGELKVDGKLQRVALSGATDVDGDAVTYSITAVTQDEPTSGGFRNDLNTPDASGVSANTVSLRGERNPSLNGRVYRISYTVTDAGGLACSGFAAVGVPPRKSVAAVDDGAQASWSSFTGALVPAG